MAIFRTNDIIWRDGWIHERSGIEPAHAGVQCKAVQQDISHRQGTIMVSTMWRNMSVLLFKCHIKMWQIWVYFLSCQRSNVCTHPWSDGVKMIYESWHPTTSNLLCSLRGRSQPPPAAAVLQRRCDVTSRPCQERTFPRWVTELMNLTLPGSPRFYF